MTALARRYANDPKADLKALAVEYKDAMRQLTRTYPNDMHAATLFAESLMDLHPWALYAEDGSPTEGTAEIVEVLAASPDPQSAADALVALANHNGGHDNTTVVVVDVLEGAAEAPVELSPTWRTDQPRMIDADERSTPSGIGNPHITVQADDGTAAARWGSRRTNRRRMIVTVVAAVVVVAALVVGFLLIGGSSDEPVDSTSTTSSASSTSSSTTTTGVGSTTIETSASTPASGG